MAGGPPELQETRGLRVRRGRTKLSSCLGDPFKNSFSFPPPLLFFEALDQAQGFGHGRHELCWATSLVFIISYVEHLGCPSFSLGWSDLEF